MGESQAAALTEEAVRKIVREELAKFEDRVGDIATGVFAEMLKELEADARRRARGRP
jgi:histone H3/H4